MSGTDETKHIISKSIHIFSYISQPIFEDSNSSWYQEPIFHWSKQNLSTDMGKESIKFTYV